MNIEDIKAKARTDHIVGRGGGLFGGGRIGELIPGTELVIGGALVQCEYHKSSGDAKFDQYQWAVNTLHCQESFVVRLLDRHEVARRKLEAARLGYIPSSFR